MVAQFVGESTPVTVRGTPNPYLYDGWYRKLELVEQRLPRSPNLVHVIKVSSHLNGQAPCLSIELKMIKAENMKTKDYSLLCFLWLGVASAPDVRGQDETAENLRQAEQRIRAIYERGEFRGRGFRANWLDDSAGYVVTEIPRGSRRPIAVRYDVATGKRTELDRRATPRRSWQENRSSDGKRILYSNRGNLYVHDLENDQRIALTKTQPNASIHNGRATWSPDGKRVAFVHSDSSKVRRRAMLVPSDPSYPQVRMMQFARVGETITALRVGVVEADGGETQWLIPASPEGHYLGQVHWAGNSNELLVEKLSRFRDEREFLLADVRTGKLKRIFRESDPAWVVASYGKNSGLEWIRDGQAFIVLSEKDGWRRASIYSRNGEEQAVLTPTDTDIIERAVLDEARGWFYYYASPDNATQKYLYRTRLDGTGKPDRVTPQDQPGTHDYHFSPDAQWALHTYSSFDTPPIIELVKLADHSVVRVLEDNQELRKKMKTIGAPETEFLQLEIDDVVVDAWMMKPADFDPSRKYPLFVYVYGEPHAQTVLDRWGTSHAEFHRLLAELGYLVVSIDNRGTPAPKGAAWRRVVFGSLGPLSTREQAAAVKELGRERSYVDLSRVGVWGWSGGGSNTLNAMFREPDVFHVGIAVAPKPQPHLYNASFQEIYMETRETNPNGYRRAAPINFAEGLKGDLLIVHGTGETNTHIQITEGLVDRLIELGKPFDYMAYPNRDHGIREGRGTTVHLRMLMVRYLLDHLPPGAR